MGSLLLITCVGFCAAIIQTTGGFGFGSLFVPLVSLIVAYRYATFMSIITCLFLQITVIIKYFRKIQWNLVIIPALVSFVTSYLGIHLMISFSSKTMAILLGIFLWLLALYLIMGVSRIVLKKNVITEIGVGALSGFSGGMFAVGGPPMIAYYDSVIDDPITYQATIQTFFFISSLAMIVEDLTCIRFNSHIIILAVCGICGCLLGTFIGTKILQRISMKTVRKIAYSVMLIAGTYNLIKGLF